MTFRALLGWSLLAVCLPAAQGNGAEPLPDSARALVAEHDARIASLRARTERRVAAQIERLCGLLAELERQFRRDGNLEAAVAIRQQIGQLQLGQVEIRSDPGHLMHYDVGAGPLYFEVVGDLNGSIWGTEVYTADSRLATAAVHAGVLEPGQRGVVVVTIMPAGTSYTGSESHGVRSSSWGSYAKSYTVGPAGRATILPPPRKRSR